MKYLKRNEDIIIYGAGRDGKLLYHKLKSKHNIKFFIDNNKNITNLYGIECIRVDDLKKYRKKEKIIIASLVYKKEMMESLYKLGYKFYDDFIPATLINSNNIDIVELYEGSFRNDEKNYKERFHAILKELCGNKELAFIHGNCQTDLIMMYLNTNKEFVDKYIFVKNLRVYQEGCFEQYKIFFECDLFKDIKLFITQNISETNKFHEKFATNTLISLLNKDCKVIRITNLYFIGYFPQHYINEQIVVIDKENLFKLGDKNINDFMQQGYTDEEIIEKLKDENFYTKEYLENRVQEEIKNIKIREESVDVKMADYIEQNYKKELLFNDCQHPTNNIIIELAKRILIFMKFKDTDVGYIDINKLDVTRELLYPSVIKAFGLDKKYNNLLYHPNRILDPDWLLSFDDYIRAYVDNRGQF